MRVHDSQAYRKMDVTRERIRLDTQRHWDIGRQTSEGQLHRLRHWDLGRHHRDSCTDTGR